MKRSFQSTVYVIFVIVTFIALAKAFMVYENPFSVYENPLVWLALIGFILVVVLKELVNTLAIKKATELQNEKDGIIPEPSNAWIQKLLKSWTNAKAVEEEQEIVLDHNYDGIRELDNSLPPWWVYMFYASIVFAIVYLVRFEVLDGDSQIVEYDKAVAEAKAELNKYRSTATDLITADNVSLLTDAKDLGRGKAIFNLNCASCHLGDGGGSIGPNLTDEYWLLGGGIKNVFTTISNGGRDGKGMIAWNKTLKTEDIAKVASYVVSLQGTTPAQSKAPQGEKWEE
ncbi:cbb3-type cytochrome c oxidase N-terminal domain-containing protein [Polaribacter sp. PL03]|uniref:cbb3-type cytochrome c oxidase N-terminal domain-containing protein n=1 Tax=Polaribacter sp. PL03 TaxID=3088353 RepID=UPI0029CF35A4|nr:cbb3-type cytochrome c oxidase N-terminal domain-containing protein [Polaribacter sp. PL03]MDX6746389.1 cbb3-type cytochrome c oxidase N-terminal domain-containing protein [Polaribacter sp. PL03]